MLILRNHGAVHKETGIMSRYYFFRTVTVDGKDRLRPLDGQTDGEGSPIHKELNTQANKKMRDSYPVGTIFGSTMCELRTKTQTAFYAAGDIYPVSVPEIELLSPSHRPSPEMAAAYVQFSAEQKASELRKASGAGDRSRNAPSLLSSLKADSRYACPTIEEDGFFIAEKDWYLLLRNVMTGMNTMLIGPSGTGKTELVMLACSKLGIRCSVYDMGSMYDPISGLLGVHRLKAGGVSEFDYAKFTKDIQQPGVVLLDELSRAPAMTNNLLFPCLDSRRSLPVEMAGGDDVRSIDVHPDCVFIATANVGAEYTGTTSLDRALVGRFFPIELDYMAEPDEVMMLIARCGLETDDARNIASVAGSIRNLYRKGELSSTVSTRETISAGRLVADGWTALEALEAVFLPLFEGSRTDGEKSIVSKIFMTR